MTDTVVGQLPGGTKVVAASLRTGQRLLTTPDEFVNSQSRFDRQSRVNLAYDVVEVTQAIYLDYVSSQVMDWSDEEKASLKTILESVAGKFAVLSFTLPETVYLVKTSGQEEGYAAYTRAKNVITLPANMVASLETSANYGDPLHPANDVTYLENVVIHECFHIFSKNNPTRRDALYALVNYHPTGNEVELPAIPWGPKGSGWTMRDFKITNPDAPKLDVYIEMVVPLMPGKKSGTLVKRPLLPLLLANGLYAGGLFFSYLQWLFMVIEQDSQGRWIPTMTSANQPILYQSSDKKLMAQYFELIGRNITGEIFHPDEIIAQNFVLVANEPSLTLLSEINTVLSHDSESGSPPNNSSKKRAR
jgi:hypothetical protein